jgi:pseudouridine synthase
VKVNGICVRDLGRQIDPETDVVDVDGRAVTPVAVGTVLVLHKPVGVVSSMVRQDQRPCLVDLLDERWSSRRLFHVGRLDQDSSGVLLLSDDGDLAQALTHPSHPVEKVYRVRLRPAPDARGEERLRDGSIVLDGRRLSPAGVERLAEDARTATFRIVLREGRNRQLRRMAEAISCRVQSLERIAFGPVGLGDLRPGEIREATEPEYRKLRELVPGRR